MYVYFIFCCFIALAYTTLDRLTMCCSFFRFNFSTHRCWANWITCCGLSKTTWILKSNHCWCFRLSRRPSMMQNWG